MNWFRLLVSKRTRLKFLLGKRKSAINISYQSSKFVEDSFKKFEGVQCIWSRPYMNVNIWIITLFTCFKFHKTYKPGFDIAVIKWRLMSVKGEILQTLYKRPIYKLQFYKHWVKKNGFFHGWSWFKFKNMILAICITLKTTNDLKNRKK